MPKSPKNLIGWANVWAKMDKWHDKWILSHDFQAPAWRTQQIKIRSLVQGHVGNHKGIVEVPFKLRVKLNWRRIWKGHNDFIRAKVKGPVSWIRRTAEIERLVQEEIERCG